MPRQMESRLPWVSLGFIMIANDHYKTEALQSKPSKTLGVFDGFDFLLARLHPFYKMPSIQRARKDELYKVAESQPLPYYCNDKYRLKSPKNLFTNHNENGLRYE